MRVEIDPKLKDIAYETVVRLRTLAPDIDFIFKDNAIEAVGDATKGREQEIHHLIDQTLYQQRIYRDTLPVRKRIYNG